MDTFLNVFMQIFYIHVCKALKKYGETASYSIVFWGCLRDRLDYIWKCQL